MRCNLPARRIAAAAGALLLLAACSGPLPGAAPPSTDPTEAPTATPFLPASPSATPAITRVWVSPALPPALRDKILQAGIASAATIEIVAAAQPGSLNVVPGGPSPLARWTYAVVAPFATVRDAMGMAELRALWQAA